jgi:hypothetical protein
VVTDLIDKASVGVLKREAALVVDRVYQLRIGNDPSDRGPIPDKVVTARR